MGFIDSFRFVNPHPEQYSWWSNRGRARENNVGWRIDYNAVTQGLKSSIKHAEIQMAVPDRSLPCNFRDLKLCLA